MEALTSPPTSSIWLTPSSAERQEIVSSSSPEPGCSARRGRPKAAAISSLILEGASSQSGIRCEICSRVFPRDKSLQAHLRVHTGERPYSCDYPGCGRRFKQSGQLKTHHRLHTGERPFICSIHGCEARFTHANRHCPTHPGAALVRSEHSSTPQLDSTLSEEVRQWLMRYLNEKQESKSEKKSKMEFRENDGSYRNGERARTRLDWDESCKKDPDFTDLKEEYGEATLDSAAPCSDMTNFEPYSCPPPVIQDNYVSTPSITHTSNYRHSESARKRPYPSMMSPVSRLSPMKSPTHISPRRLHILSPNRLVLSPNRHTSPYRALHSRSTGLLSPLNASTPLPSKAAVKSLFTDPQISTITSPRKRELPKKRWLRIANRELERANCANESRPTVLRFLSSTPFLTPPYSDQATREESPAVGSVQPQTDTWMGSSYEVKYSNVLNDTFPPQTQMNGEEEEALAVPLANESFDYSHYKESWE